MISIVIVDSRSKQHPEWLEMAISSAKGQILKCEVIVVDNTDNKMTIGEAFNKGVEKAKGDWIFFLGDEDYLTKDYSIALQTTIDNTKRMKVVHISTYMTTFDEKGQHSILQRRCTGLIKKDYLLEYPFDETLKEGVDRDWYDKLEQRGDISILIPYHFGYFYRRHNDNTSKPMTLGKKPQDIYIIANSTAFIDPIAKRLDNVFIDQNGFDPDYANEAKVIWQEWGNKQALQSSEFKTDAKKILRIHAFEAFNNTALQIDYNKFDKVIFVSSYIKEFLEKRLGYEIPNSVIIPNGVELDKFKLHTEKTNNIAWAGNIIDGKGIQLLLFVARHFPEYNFHIAGKCPKLDVIDYIEKKKSDNVYLYPYQHEIQDWLKDKSYIMSTSIRESQHMTVMEGMASGMKPLVYDWIGAKDIYGETWDSINSLYKLLIGSYEPEKYRKFIKDNYNFEVIYPKIEKIIMGE